VSATGFETGSDIPYAQVQFTLMAFRVHKLCAPTDDHSWGTASLLRSVAADYHASSWCCMLVHRAVTMVPLDTVLSTPLLSMHQQRGGPIIFQGNYQCMQRSITLSAALMLIPEMARSCLIMSVWPSWDAFIKAVMPSCNHIGNEL
jgi:hypothetical protein